jgi:hypothetical protein
LEVEKPSTVRRLSRRAQRLIYNVSWKSTGPCSLRELDILLREHLSLPVGADDYEPLFPIEAASAFLKHGGALCGAAEPDSVGAGLRLVLDGLHVLASHGDRDAIRALVDGATHAANTVKEIAASKPEMLRPIARSREEWPSTISLHPDWQQENKDIIASLEVGTQSRVAKQLKVTRLPTKGKDERRKRYRHLVPVLCERLVDIVDAARDWLNQRQAGMQRQGALNRAEIGARRKSWRLTREELENRSPWILQAGELGELNGETAIEWFRVGWDGLKALTKKPHDLPFEFMQMGAFEEKKKARKEQTSASKRRANRRHGLKPRHRDVFMKLFGR